MSYRHMLNASAIYQQTSVRGGVEDADAHQLISMLLDGAIDRISQARGCMLHGNVAGKGGNISRAVAILGELREGLDHKVDPAFSQRLDSVYEYVTRRLLHAQLNDDPAALDESVRLLTPIREGWQAIRAEYLSTRQAGGAR